jgi:hypothetical protein
LNGPQNFSISGTHFLFAARHRIELVLELGGEVVVDVPGEVAAEELRHRAADVDGTEAAAFHLHVLAEQQRLDDRGIRGRTADAVFLQRLDQRRFGEARRRLGEVLVGVDAFERHAVARLHRRQLAAFVVVLGGLGVLAFLVHGEEARIDHGRAAGAEAVFVAGGQVDADGVERGRHHLRGDARFQISSYRRRSSSLRKRETCAGVRSAEVGRTASCASCAFFDLVW